MDNTTPKGRNKLTWAEYQQATSATAIYPQGHKEIYTLLGLVGELGEVCNLTKKVLRGDYTGIDDPLFQFKFIDEIGDVYWYAAQWMLAHGGRVDWGEYNNPKRYLGVIGFMNTHYPPVNFDPSVLLSYHLLSLNALIAPYVIHLPENLHGFCLALLERLRVIVEHLMGLDVQDIWDANLKKLTGRKQANTLQGHNREDETDGKAK